MHVISAFVISLCASSLISAPPLPSNLLFLSNPVLRFHTNHSLNCWAIYSTIPPHLFQQFKQHYFSPGFYQTTSIESRLVWFSCKLRMGSHTMSSPWWDSITVCWHPCSAFRRVVVSAKYVELLLLTRKCGFHFLRVVVRKMFMLLVCHLIKLNVRFSVLWQKFQKISQWVPLNFFWNPLFILCFNLLLLNDTLR